MTFSLIKFIVRSTINVSKYNIVSLYFKKERERERKREREREREREKLLCACQGFLYQAKFLAPIVEDFIGVSSESCCLNYINQAIAMVLVTNSIFMQ